MSKPLITGASFHEFDKDPKFIGVLGTPVIRENDDPSDDKKKKGDIMGYNFTNFETGEVEIIGSSHQIKKAVEMCKPGDVLSIEFKGQTENGKGQKVNLFKIDLLEQADIDALKHEA